MITALAFAIVVGVTERPLTPIDWPANTIPTEAAQACVLTHVIEAIHAVPWAESPKDRFLIVSDQDSPERYGQCLLLEEDRGALCEMASGAWYRGLMLSAGERRWMARAGFRLHEKDGNYQRWLDLSTDADRDGLASVLLHGMYDGFGTRPGRLMLATADSVLDLDTIRAQPCPRPGG